MKRSYKVLKLGLLFILFNSANIYSQESRKYEYGAEGNCGNDCVLRVFHRYGVPESPDGLFDITKDLVQNGDKIISFYDMKQLFEGIGFYTEAYNTSFEELKNLPGIKICHFGEDHFIVIEKIEKETITIFNPPLKVEVIPIEQFLEKWDGTVLVVEKGDSIDRKPSIFPPFPRLFSDVLKYDWGVIKKDGTLYYDFMIWNLGEEILEIKNTHASCNCTSFTMDKKMIESGDKAVLSCRIDTEGKYEKDDVGITVESNNQETPLINFKITGEVIRTIEVLPSKINLGLIPVNASKTRLVSFRGTGVKTEKIDKINFSDENMKCKRMIEYSQEVNRGGFEFETRWINSPGNFEEKITVYFKENCFDPMEITVTGQYQSPVRLDQEAVFIEKGKDTLNIKGDIQLMIEKPFQKEYQVKEVKTDLFFMKVIFRKNKDGYLISYEGIIPGMAERPADGKIFIIGDTLPENCRIVNIYFIPAGE
jgi:predicted double-glycine peptidase